MQFGPPSKCRGYLHVAGTARALPAACPFRAATASSAACRGRNALFSISCAHAEAQTSPGERLRNWVLESGSTMPTALVPAEGVSVGGYGMVCVEAVAAGQQLVNIPRKLLMTVETASQSQACGALVQEAGLTEWQTLILHLLCERAKGQDSFWAPYLAILPDQSQHPLMWGPAQLSWLQGSPLQSILLQRQQQVQQDLEDLLISGANEDLELAQELQSPLVSEVSVRWAACTLLSRAFRLDMTTEAAAEEEALEHEAGASSAASWLSPSSDTLALVPWADMLCHSSEAGPQSCLRYCPESESVQLQAHTSYPGGAEVYDSYGPHLSPGDLLMDYGFVDTSNSNYKIELEPRDVASPSSGRARALQGALASVQGAAARLALSPRGPDLTSLTWLRAAVATDAELIRAGWRVKASEKDVELACRVMGTLSQPISLDNEVKVLRSILSFIDSQVQRYPSTLAADREEEQDPATDWLRCQVLRALISEKSSLIGCQEVVVAWLDKLQSGTPVQDLYNDWDWGFGLDEGEEWDEGEQ